MKPRLSIIITSFNRPNLLLRSIKFLVSYKLPIQLIILDSSKKKFESTEFNNLVKEFNIIVKKFDTDIFITSKIAIGCEFINTDYSVLYPDDDFFSPISFLKCVDFMDANPDYSSAQGLYFSHTNYEETAKNGFKIAQLYIDTESLVDEKSSDRIKKYLDKVKNTTIYAVHKTKDFKLIWEKSNHYVDANDWAFAEYLPSCLSIILGKMKILPIFYASREPNVGAPFSPPLYFEKIYKISRSLADFLNQYENISLSDAEKLFVNYFSAIKKNMSKKPKSIEVFIKHVKVFIIKLLSKLLRLVRFDPSNVKKYSSRFNINLSDVDKIKLAVISSQDPHNEIINSRKLYIRKYKKDKKKT